MGQRLDLQTFLETITPAVYFQPTINTKMVYPCIVYKRVDEDAKYAGNKLYNHTKMYQVTVIDRNPDSTLPDDVRALPLCSFDRHYTAEGLNHDVFNLYF